MELGIRASGELCSQLQKSGEVRPESPVSGEEGLGEGVPLLRKVEASEGCSSSSQQGLTVEFWIFRGL